LTLAKLVDRFEKLLKLLEMEKLLAMLTMLSFRMTWFAEALIGLSDLLEVMPG